MTTTQHLNSHDQRLKNWCDSLVSHSAGAKSLTIGLISGNRYPNDARVIYRIAKALSLSILEHRRECSMLLCRLDVKSNPLGLFGTSDDSDVEVRVERSALGEWDNVEIPVTVGNVATKSLKQVPRLVPKWKTCYRTIVMDLGPIHQLPSRTIGRICDFNYVVLGPNSTASAKWISQYVDYHHDCGAYIAGTIVASASELRHVATA